MHGTPTLHSNQRTSGRRKGRKNTHFFLLQALGNDNAVSGKKWCTLRNIETGRIFQIWRTFVVQSSCINSVQQASRDNLLLSSLTKATYCVDFKYRNNQYFLQNLVVL